MIKIYTDALSTLTKSTENLEILPILFNIDGKKYLTNELESKEIYNYLSQGVYPKTSRPNLGIWSEIVEKDLKEGKDILYIGPTSKMTGVTSSINVIKNIIKNKYPNRSISILNTNLVSGAIPLIIEDVMKDSNYEPKDEKYCTWVLLKSTFTMFNNNRLDTNIDKISLLKLIDGKLGYHSSYNTYYEAIDFIKKSINKKIDKVLISYSYDMGNDELSSYIKEEFKNFTNNIDTNEMNSCLYSYYGIGSFDISMRYN